MKINITKKDYQLLIELMSIGELVINSVHDDNEVSTEHSNLYQKFLSYSKEIGLEKYVEYSSEFEEYFVTRELEENLFEEYLKPYQEELFWSDLTYQLAVRDAINQYSEEKFKNMELFDRLKAISVYEEQYDEEFSNFGLSRIKIHKYNA